MALRANFCDRGVSQLPRPLKLAHHSPAVAPLGGERDSPHISTFPGRPTPHPRRLHETSGGTHHNQAGTILHRFVPGDTLIPA